MILRAFSRLILVLLLVAPTAALAQSPAPSSPPLTPQLLKPEELDQLVAPIALYPDPLLAEVLMASTYPLDIVQAERWMQSHKTLKPDETKAAIDKQDWDQSIKTLVATPDVLAMMSEKIDWTEKLGDAVVAQQPDVMDAVQRLRARAQSNNKLTSNKQQTIKVTQVQNKQVIAIEPTDPETIYVPYYDPAVAYGDWPYPDYPPYYWPAPGYIGAGILATGLAFGAGYALGRWAGGNWGGSVNWNNNNINIDRGGNNAFKPRVDHRQNAGNRGGRGQGDFRNSRGEQVLNRGNNGNRGNAGNQVNNGNRGNAGNRGGNRPSAGTRPAGGNRNHAANRPSKGGAHRGNAGAGHGNRGGGAGVAHRGAGAGHRAMGGGGSGHRAMAGGGGHRGGGGGGGGRGGAGGRRSDIRLKHDIVLLGHLDNGLGFYRFSYIGSEKAYVGVIAQEVREVDPAAVIQGRDGYLRVYYEKLGLKFESYDRWLKSGGQLSSSMRAN